MELEGEREVSIIFEVQSSSLENLDEKFIETSVTVWATSNSVEDAASLELPVTLKRTSDVNEETAGEGGSVDWVGIAIWVVGGALIVALLGVLLMVLNGNEEEEEQNWSEVVMKTIFLQLMALLPQHQRLEQWASKWQFPRHLRPK